MNLKHLQAFVAVVEEGSFSGAACRLGLAPSTLTERIKALEREVSAELLVRRPLTLTLAGQVFYPHAKISVDRALRAVDALRDLRGPAGLRLVIGLFLGGAAEMQPVIMSALRRSLPRCSLHLVDLPLPHMLDAVLTHRVDVAIVRSPVNDPRVETVQFYTQPRLVMTNRCSAWAGATELRMSDVIDATFNNVTPLVPQEFADFYRLVPQRGHQPRVVGGPAAMSLADVGLQLEQGALTTSDSDAPRLTFADHLRCIPLIDAPHGGPVAIKRLNDRRTAVMIFMEVAAHVARTCTHLIPDADPPGQA